MKPGDADRRVVAADVRNRERRPDRQAVGIDQPPLDVVVVVVLPDDDKASAAQRRDIGCQRVAQAADEHLIADRAGGGVEQARDDVVIVLVFVDDQRLVARGGDRGHFVERAPGIVDIDDVGRRETGSVGVQDARMDVVVGGGEVAFPDDDALPVGEGGDVRVARRIAVIAGSVDHIQLGADRGVDAGGIDDRELDIGGRAVDAVILPNHDRAPPARWATAGLIWMPPSNSGPFAPVDCVETVPSGLTNCPMMSMSPSKSSWKATKKRPSVITATSALDCGLTCSGG